MKLSTALPVAHIAFKHWAPDDSDVCVVVAKARFLPSDDGRFRAEQTPPELRLADELAPGEPGYQECKHEGDLCPGKPATDVLLRAIARSPGGRPRQRWKVGLTVGDRLSHAFEVRGPSEWRCGVAGWRLTEPEQATEVPLCHALAYGGAGPSSKDPDVVECDERNPAGRGFASSGMLRAGDPFPAPQIGYMQEFGAGGPETEMAVVGVTPVAKGWMPRRALGGTFDAAWQEERHPRMPKDYDLAFWNCAHPTMQALPPLKGTETVELTGLSADGPLRYALPGVGLRLQVLRLPEGHAASDLDGLTPEEIAALPEEARAEAAEEAAARIDRAACETVEMEMALTTVEIDVQSRDPAAHAMTLVWTLAIPEPHRHPEAAIEGVRMTRKEPADADVA